MNKYIENTTSNIKGIGLLKPKDLFNTLLLLNHKVHTNYYFIHKLKGSTIALIKKT